MRRVLVVDDERSLRLMLAAVLDKGGYATDCVSSGEEGLAHVGAACPDLILLDMNMEGMDGMQTLRHLKEEAPEIPVVMMTAYGNIETAVSAMRLGAADFVVKPFQNQKLLDCLRLLLALREAAPQGAGQAVSLIGQSEAFRDALTLARKFAVPDINILLLGETGTGKEQFAQAIHAASKRRGRPFVAVDCSALPENLIESELFGHEKGAFTGALTARIGRFEQAEGGTLFLDEIGNLPTGLQCKLLRILQTRRMERIGGRRSVDLDVRVIAATNSDVQNTIRSGVFREDLYYRLQEMTIRLPPLRERRGDVTLIARHYCQHYARLFALPSRSLSMAALAALEAYHWPGNVRELENAIKSAVVLAGGEILPEHLPREVRACAPRLEHMQGQQAEQRFKVEIDIGMSSQHLDLKTVGSLAIEQTERAFLSALVNRHPMTSSSLARMLGVDRKTLRTKLRKYGLAGGCGR